MTRLWRAFKRKIKWVLAKWNKEGPQRNISIEQERLMSEGKVGAWRMMLSKEYEDALSKTDWLSAPSMFNYRSKLVSGKDESDGGGWEYYANDRHLIPLLEHRIEEDSNAFAAQTTEKGLSMLSVGCGDGRIEEHLLNCGWPIGQLVGLEYDTELLRKASDRFSNKGKCQAVFKHFDFNKSDVHFGQFDIVFFCHSMHHCTNIEDLLKFINISLKPNGLIIGLDYFGPTRFQVEPEILEIVEELFSYLPPQLRVNLASSDLHVDEEFIRPTIKDVVGFDPSEAARSSDLRTLLFSTFPIIDIKPMGGTIFRWLLKDRAGNFRGDEEFHMCIIKLLQFIERKLIETKNIRSDDLFFVLGPCKRLH